MTAVLAPGSAPTIAPSSGTGLWTIGAPRLLAGLDLVPRLDLRGHLATHGALPPADADRLLAWLDRSGIAGRGGAGFPLEAKLRALHRPVREVIVNGSESEPASLKDRTLMARAPHLVLDGAVTVAAAFRARRITVAVHDGGCATSLCAAVAERSDAGRVAVRVVPGGFVSGEARALVRALHGGPALPPGRRTPATAAGILVSNAETFAQLAILARIGPQRFAETGTPSEPGTSLLTIGGAVGRPGVIEAPLGTPLGIMLAAARAAEPQAIVLGGYHGSWLPPDPRIRLSRDGAAQVGGSFGAGVLLVLDRYTCGLGELSRVAGWLAAQSARQCGPCRFGLPALASDVAALVAGHSVALGAAFGHAQVVDGRGACAHPDGAARFVRSGLRVLRDEVETHLRSGSCGRHVLGQLPIGASA